MATNGTTTPEPAEADGKPSVRDTAEKMIDNARETATHALETTRDAARRTAAGLEENPIALLAGGIAVGALIGALLPRPHRERKLLAPLGKRIAESATAAVHAARDTGKAEIEGLLPNADAAKEQVGKLIGKVVDAAKAATKDT